MDLIKTYIISDHYNQTLQRLKMRAAPGAAAYSREGSQGFAIEILEVGFKPKFGKGLREYATICEAVRSDI